MNPIERIRHTGNTPLFRATSIEQMAAEAQKPKGLFQRHALVVIAGVIVYRRDRQLVIQDPNDGASLSLPVPEGILEDERRHAASVLLLSGNRHNGHSWSLIQVLEPPLIAQPELLERTIIAIVENRHLW